ncbi:glycosyltransferase family 2 protein [Anoxybacillus salavatliensis]|uniref:glycosyltransferase family 2 protein n=1 Tax=Anoxybacillus gonensis TaxID=198467 RepID=UPI00214AE5AA|nr:glycosyltransferase family 2 protein [Anoxybacillus gonensis]MCQ5363558.1 glycosyltransferase family 2 protein [Anoxybacillus gonensis]
MKRVAVLMCCYNRKNKTVRSVQEIYKQEIESDFKVDIYLLDDGSMDGTEEAILLNFPEVNIIKGDGNYFWNGGMRAAYDEAKKGDYDFYVWLNDDTFIYKDTFKILLSTYYSLEEKYQEYPKIIVGTTTDQNGNLTYGGVKKFSIVRPVKYKIVYPDRNKVNECDTFNGNIVLIDKKVYKLVGNLDAAFVHGMGDFDFGLRAKKKGAKLFVAPGILGICEKNPIKGTYNDTSLSLVEGYKKLLSIKGLPIKQWYVYTKRHAGLFWFVYFAKPYIEYAPKFMLRKHFNR